MVKYILYEGSECDKDFKISVVVGFVHNAIGKINTAGTYVFLGFVYKLN